MDEITLAHLSDLHLGNDFVLRSLLRKRLWWKTEDKELLRGLEIALREVHPDYVVITGDIVNKCTPANFRNAAKQLRTTLSNAGVDVKNRVLVIPGNHDVKVAPQEHEYFGRLLEFIHFLRLFFDEPDTRSRKANFVRVDVACRLCFVCLDSTLKDKQPLAEGEVGVGQWEWFNRKLGTLWTTHPDLDRFVKIVAIHHHPHPIQAAGTDRFMQLLDAGTAVREFERHGVNVVLHGHKHFPHERLQSVGGGTHYTVVGAGTVTCPFQEEQAGEGNSFNVIKLRPDSNLLELQRWKANSEKRYAPTLPEPRRFPLFQPSESGYKMAEFRSVTRIVNLEGTCIITKERVGLMVDRDDFELRNIGFRIHGLPRGARILAVDFDRENISEIRHEIEEERERKGHFVLRKALRWGSEPSDLWFTYHIHGAVCMRRDDFESFYPANKTYVEKLETFVVHPCDQLSVAVEFPPGFSTRVWPRVRDRNDNELDIKGIRYTFHADRLASRYTLVVRRPLLNHEYSLCWEVLV